MESVEQHIHELAMRVAMLEECEAQRKKREEKQAETVATLVQMAKETLRRIGHLVKDVAKLGKRIDRLNQRITDLVGG